MALNLAVEKRLDGFRLELDLEVPPGITVVFGDSGAGKSLALRMIAGLLRPDRGRVELDGRILEDREAGVCLRPQEREVGFVFQEPSAFPHMTVEENIGFGGRGIGEGEREKGAGELIERFRLSGLERRLPREISGGQEQRVVLARALMQRPRALLLDEPFSALDLLNRRWMRECLAEVIRELGIPVLLVTHDLVEALTLADRLVVMINGGIVQQGTPRELVCHPEGEKVAALLDLDSLKVDWLDEGD